MLSNEKKRELREYFEIKNISYWKTREGYLKIDEYYEVLLGRMNKAIQKQEEEKRKQEDEEKRLQQEEEDKQKDLKRRLKNKLKKLRKRLNKKIKEISDTDEDTDDEIQQVKPYVFFSPSLQNQFNDNLYLIEMLNQYYDNNENYRNFLLENNYEKIKITRCLHRGFTDEYHFNGFFYSGDDKIISTCIHFYVENDIITKLSKIIEIF